MRLCKGTVRQPCPQSRQGLGTQCVYITVCIGYYTFVWSHVLSRYSRKKYWETWSKKWNNYESVRPSEEYEEMHERNVLKGYGDILKRKASGSWAIFREDYTGWYSEAMYKDDAAEGIYRVWGPLIIRLLCASFLNIWKAVADKMAVLFICILGFFTLYIFGSVEIWYIVQCAIVFLYYFIFGN